MITIEQGHGVVVVEMGKGLVVGVVFVCALLCLPGFSQQRSVSASLQEFGDGVGDVELDAFMLDARASSSSQVGFRAVDRSWRPAKDGDDRVAVEPSSPDDPPPSPSPSPSPPPPSPSPPPPSPSPPPPSPSPPPPSPSPPPPSPSPPPPSPSPPPPSPSPSPPSPSPPSLPPPSSPPPPSPPPPSPPPPSPPPPSPSPPPPSPPPPSPPPPPPPLAPLSLLKISNGARLCPPFHPDVYVYHTNVGEYVRKVRVTASVPSDITGYELRLNSTKLISGEASPPIPVGANGETVNFTVTVSAPGYSPNSYFLSVHRREKSYIWWKVLKWAVMAVLGILLIVAIIFCCYHVLPLGRRQPGYEPVNPALVDPEDRSGESEPLI